MSFLSPILLWWLLPIVGAIIALYLLKMRRQDVRVPAAFLWPRLTSDVRANAPVQRLRWSLLLILQLLAAALVVVALADPLHRTQGLAGAATVIVIDDSASMQSTDVAPTRFDAAVSRAQAIAGAMNSNDRLAVIEAGAATRIVSPLSNDKSAIRQALRSLSPSDAPSAMGDALRLAAALVAGRQRARIVVLSDGTFQAVTDFSPGQADLRYEQIGTSYKNVAVTAFDSALAGNGSLQCFAAIRNYDSSPLPVTISFTTDGHLVDARQFEAPAGQSTGETFAAPAGARVAQVEIASPGDILSADNTATLFLKGVGTVRTLLVTSGDLFLERALSLDPSIELERSASVPDFEKLGSSGTGRYDLVIFDNVAPEPVKAAAIWSLGMPSAEFGVADSGISLHPQVKDWAQDDPVTRYADLRGIDINSAHRVRTLPGSGANVLVQGSDGPLIVSTNPPGRRTLYTAWSVLDSDFPLQVSFPIFVANGISWLTTGAGRAAGEQGGVMARVGQPFSVATPGGEATLIRPDGSSERLDASSGAAVIRSADLVGRYTVESGQTRTQIAVNLLDESASDVRPQPTLNITGAAIAAAKSPGLMLADLWRPIIVAVLAVLCLEWWVFVRRS